MHKLSLFPLGNADTCLINLAVGKRILFDFAAVRNPDDKSDRRIDLPAKLREDLAATRENAYDVVAITHLDDDHTHGADEFFYLDNAAKYQSATRIKIKTLWVPACAITESRNDLEAGAAAIQAEARHRLENGYGVRVFSRPAVLETWLKSKGLTLESRAQFITDAGNTAPELTIAKDGVEFFVHSPFAWRQDEKTIVDRNCDSLVMQATFDVETHLTRVILGSDVDHVALTEIVTTTKKHKREDRLAWDVIKLPHHCSYLSLGPDRGVDKTKPVDNVKWLFETQGQRGCVVVSTSDPIPMKGSEQDDSDQPPHRQAANYYRDLRTAKDGEFLITMEHPTVMNPEPLEIEITVLGATPKKKRTSAAGAITSTVAPRAG